MTRRIDVSADEHPAIKPVDNQDRGFGPAADAGLVTGAQHNPCGTIKPSSDDSTGGSGSKVSEAE